MARSKSIRAPVAWASVHQQIEAQRRQLQRASAVLTSAIAGVECDVDIEVLGDTITVGRELVDAACGGLDSVNLNSRRNR
jgi:hypothetical protein